MKIGKIVIMILGLLSLSTLPRQLLAGVEDEYTLEFIPTQNAPSGIRGKEPLPTEGREVPSIPATTRPGFPAEGNGVSPLARLDAGFTSGMGADPGAAFVTDHKGDGKVLVKLDYDLIRRRR